MEDVENKKIKELFKFLLEEIFNEDKTEPNYGLIEQVILRKAYALGYVELDENKDFILSDKGKEFIEE